VHLSISEHCISIKVKPRNDTYCDMYHLWEGNDTNSFKIIERNNSDSENATFPNLTGGTQYNFSIIAIAGNLSSETYTFLSYTRKYFFICI
jgi:hypothetical protein